MKQFKNYTNITNITIITLVFTFIAASCSPSALNTESTTQVITGTIAYANLTANVGNLLSVQPSKGIIPNNATLTYRLSSENLPQGLSFNVVSGTITGISHEEFQETSYTVLATGTNKYEGSIESNTFTISIDSNVTENQKDISSSTIRYSNKHGIVGQAFLLNPSTNIVPANATVKYSIFPTTLPNGLIFHTDTGWIVGTPESTLSSSFFTLTMSGIDDYTSAVLSNPFAITITNPTLEIQNNINSSSIQYTNKQSILGQAFLLEPNKSIVPSNAVVNYSINPIRLPNGLIFHSNSGVIDGIPNAVFPLTYYSVTATGNAKFSGSIISNSFTISVHKIPITGTLRYFDLSNNVNKDFIINPQVHTDSSVPANILSYSITTGSLPDGLTFSTETGIISGTARTTANSTLQVTATASGNYTASIRSNTFNITVLIEKIPIEGSLRYDDTNTLANEDLNIRPQITTTPNVPDNVLSYTINSGSLPDGLTFSTETGIISGTARTHANSTLRIAATASGNYTGTLLSNAFNLTLNIIDIEGSFAYPNDIIEGVVREYLSVLPTLSITPSEATLLFSEVSNLHTLGSIGLTINPVTGAIEGTPATTTSTVLARQVKVEGTGIYGTTLYSREFSIRILSK